MTVSGGQTYPARESSGKVVDAVVTMPHPTVVVKFTWHVGSQSCNETRSIIERAVLGTSHPNETCQEFLQNPFGRDFGGKLLHLQENYFREHFC